MQENAGLALYFPSCTTSGVFVLCFDISFILLCDMHVSADTTKLLQQMLDMERSKVRWRRPCHLYNEDLTTSLHV